MPRPPLERCSAAAPPTRVKAADGPVEMVRVFKLAKASATKSHSQAINQLKSVLVSADPELRGARCSSVGERALTEGKDIPPPAWPAAGPVHPAPRRPRP
jgi:hypothetical protein